MKLRELLDLIENGPHVRDAQVFIGGELFEVLSAEIDADGDLVLMPDLNRTAETLETGCPVGYIPHPRGSDPDGCVECRAHVAARV